jgi:AcrR family transcriptional regulator
MATKNLVNRSARERLLAAADELFYEEGVHTVGIDRVIERAGVAKASLYNAFGSKDELIRAYLRQRHAATRERTTSALATRYDSPKERLLGVFDVLGEMAAESGFRGCAFINASAESLPGGVVEEVSCEARAWLYELFVDLARAAGAGDPAQLARKLVLLYDGASVGARMDHDPRSANAARSVAMLVLDAALRPD